MPEGWRISRGKLRTAEMYPRERQSKGTREG